VAATEHPQNSAPHANLPAESVNFIIFMQHRSCFSIPLGKVKLKLTNGGEIKNSFKPFSNQILVKAYPIKPITRPIQSGATVPLKAE
jgi:hypothetical protein